ncbi:vanadium-dependent haloperoxidase [Nonomuraea sp. K274]|uniref:Vanadium-dependent haloperoxidase n=1 Tax=Nonomuraea cypriaca TaxID=1187855 RepID=A0A931AH55_9ACTN|nr:vanadium-dependent haloperoxidase [Nonomuraea cypriaca]MBF8192882.1 vanadium-dependent haloperoxidase [Nonomuraea cypriaca]
MFGRRAAARERRIAAAEEAFSRPVQEQLGNGEEADYPFIANYGKALPHGEDGVVLPEGYRGLLRALSTRRAEDFERIPRGSGENTVRLTNPQAGLSFDLEGPDAQALAMPPAPRIDSAQNSAEMVELYWMALLRDVPFANYDSDPMVMRAVNELSDMMDYRGPRKNGRVTPEVLFRGGVPGALRGPYISQFLLRDIPFGTLPLPQLHDTVRVNQEYLTDWHAWLDVQNGVKQPPQDRNPNERRYLHTARDLAHYVHYDFLYQAHLGALLILLGMKAEADVGNPYENSRNQAGFATFGPPHIQSLLAEVATRAAKAVWYSKWFVHRRLRPEEFGGRVHAHVSGIREFPMIQSEVLGSEALKTSFDRYGSYLLPQAFPEGCPTHPAYGSGHATVAGACVTVLKAWFDESFPLPNPVVADSSGTKLVPYKGPALLIGGELNKLAANIALGRSMAAVHWRTDFTASVKLGEAIAIDMLREQKAVAHEDVSFTLSRFDGMSITI